MTLTEIALSNLKCFRSLSLPLRPLSVLTGYNAGGKSTVLQAILLLTQSLRQSSQAERLSLNGDMVSVGNPGDVLCRSVSDSRSIGIELATAAARGIWRFEASPQHRGVLLLNDTERQTLGTGIDDDLLRTVRETSFLSTARANASDVMPIPSGSGRPPWDVGRDGSYAAFILDERGADPVDSRRRLRGNDTETVQGQVDGWLDVLFPGARASARVLEDAQLMRLEFKLGRAAGWVKPSNIGFGLGYAFPLLVALMTAPAGAVLIVDSPEAHLHPRAQSLLGRALAQIAGAGVQIIVETHSDHLLNGIRLGVRDRAIRSGDVAIHFFEGGDDERTIASLSIGDDGALSDWPMGFFDQALNDLVELS